MTQLHLTLQPASPRPPAQLGDLAVDDHTYLGYFQDPAGDQWFYVLDRDHPNATGLLYSNRYAWTPYLTMSGAVPGLVLDPPVAQWLQLVTAAAQAQAPRYAQPDRHPPPGEQLVGTGPVRVDPSPGASPQLTYDELPC